MKDTILWFLKKGPVHIDILKYLFPRLDVCLTELIQGGGVRTVGPYYWHKDVDPSSLFR